MKPFLFEAIKGKVVPHLLSHEGEEFIFIVEGTLKMQVGDTEYRLNARNNFYFSALQKHGVIPVPDKVLYIIIFV